MRAYTRVLDEDFAQRFSDGFRLENDAARSHARTLTAEAIATRRAGCGRGTGNRRAER